MRKAHLFNLLRPVYRMGPLSRADLAAMTKVAPSHVSVSIRGALERGFLVERGFVPSNGGRPRVLLEANPGFAKLVGIDIGRFHTRIVATDFVGNVLDYKWFPTEPLKGKDHLLQAVHDEVKSSMTRFPGIAAIGISHSGVVDPARCFSGPWSRVGKTRLSGKSSKMCMACPCSSRGMVSAPWPSRNSALGTAGGCETLC